MKIGSHTLNAPLILAPMAGISDLPFRQLCRRFGAGLTVSEMTSSRAELRHSNKTRLRCKHDNEPDPISVQIVGTDPEQMAEAARWNVQQGAQIIDINMGCPAKKVCNVLAGSALMKDEQQVARILESVVSAVPVPVTLKIRTGWDKEHRNAPQVAKIAQDSGIQAIAIHGRTRTCAYRGNAEYDTIAQVKSETCIPIIANGDITNPHKAAFVLEYTHADALMIGRAAQGRPWIFREIADFLQSSNHSMFVKEPVKTSRHKSTQSNQVQENLLYSVVSEHLQALYHFYGEYQGVRIARKHILKYINNLELFPATSTANKKQQFWKQVSQIDNTHEQYQITCEFLTQKL